jgi:hypothetical protein
MIRRLLLLACIGACAVIGRRRLVHLLTRATGTWVGAPNG